MPTITKKKVKGHTYYYAVQSAWMDGKSRIVWQKYLGKPEDIVRAMTGEVLKPFSAKIFQFGAVAALYSFAKRLGLVELIDQHAPKRQQGPSVGQYMLIAALNRAIAPTSKRQIGQWYSSTSLSRWMAVKPEQLTSQRFWDHMGYLTEEAIHRIEVGLTDRMVREFHLDLRAAIFDTTNFLTWMDTVNEAELPQRGHNKQKRDDLRQVGLALMTTLDFHIPLFHEVYPGNQPDAKEFSSVVDDLVSRYQRLSGECHDIALIFDKGNNSKGNIQRVSGSVKFVGSLVPSQHPDLLSVPLGEFHSLEGSRFGGMKVYRTRKEVFGVQRTVLVTYNEALYLGQMQGLVAQLRKANDALRELKSRLAKRVEQTRPRGTAPTKETVLAQVKEILKKPLDRIIQVTVREDNGQVLLDYEIDHDAEKTYAETYFGKNVLFTNQDEWPDSAIVCAYRGQAAIEEAFKVMKNPHFIGWSPMYHWTDAKIRVHAFYCVLALTLASLLCRELHHKGIEMSIPSILEELAGIYEVAHIYPSAAKQKDVFTLSERTEAQQKLVEALGLEEMHRAA